MLTFEQVFCDSDDEMPSKRARVEAKQTAWALAIDEAYERAKETAKQEGYEISEITRHDLNVVIPAPDGVDEEYYQFQADDHMQLHAYFNGACDDVETYIKLYKEAEASFEFKPEVAAKDCQTCKRLVKTYTCQFKFGEDGLVYCRGCGCAAHQSWLEPCREGGDCCCDFEHCQEHHMEG